MPSGRQVDVQQALSGCLRSSCTPYAVHERVASGLQRRHVARAQRRTCGKIRKPHSLAPRVAALIPLHGLILILAMNN